MRHSVSAESPASLILHPLVNLAKFVGHARGRHSAARVRTSMRRGKQGRKLKQGAKGKNAYAVQRNGATVAYTRPPGQSYGPHAYLPGRKWGDVQKAIKQRKLTGIVKVSRRSISTSKGLAQSFADKTGKAAFYYKGPGKIGRVLPQRIQQRINKLAQQRAAKKRGRRKAKPKASSNGLVKAYTRRSSKGKTVHVKQSRRKRRR